MLFDRQQVALISGLQSSQRVSGDISMASQPVRSGAIVKPATVSGYVNFFTEADYFWEPSKTALRFDAEAVVRAGDLVFESEFSLVNDINSQLCPTNALCLFDHNGGFKRQGSRVVYDSLPTLSRFTLGDTHTSSTTFQRAPDVLGFKLEHSPSLLAPLNPIRSIGSQSFILARPATVEVIINGAIAQRLHLAPGTFNLRDLPLRAGANDIELLITDDSGATRTLRFNSFSAAGLLAAGKSEWSLSGGVPSYSKDGTIAYVQNQIFGTGFYRFGLTNQLTVEAQAQADNHVAMAGGGLVASNAFGIWTFNVATSLTDGDIGVGGAAGLTWELSAKDNSQALRLSAEIHTDRFRAPGQLRVAPTGIILPVYDFKDSFSATYNQALGEDWQATITGRYDIENRNFITANPLVAHGNRYHVDVTLSHPLSSEATISGTVGYSNEIYNRSFADQVNLSNTKAELWAGIRLLWRPNAKSTIAAASETLNGRSLATGNYETGSGLDNWSANVAVSDDRFAKTTTTSGDVTYNSQRAEVTVGQDVSGSTLAGDSGRPATSRSRLRVGTALAFAEDSVAFTRPIRGTGGFAILQPHDSIADRTVTAGSADNLRGKSDTFGPAVVGGLSPYFPQTLPIDVANLPTGYSLGQSGFDLKPAYKSGYKLQVGSGYSVTAIGELRDRRGEPLQLATGVASDGQRQVTVFTNQGGKLAADGLAPGSWKLTMDSDEGTLIYTIKVPAKTQGLLRIGTLSPVKG